MGKHGTGDNLFGGVVTAHRVDCDARSFLLTVQGLPKARPSRAVTSTNRRYKRSDWVPVEEFCQAAGPGHCIPAGAIV